VRDDLSRIAGPIAGLKSPIWTEDLVPEAKFS